MLKLGFKGLNTWLKILFIACAVLSLYFLRQCIIDFSWANLLEFLAFVLGILYSLFSEDLQELYNNFFKRKIKELDDRTDDHERRLSILENPTPEERKEEDKFIEVRDKAERKEQLRREKIRKKEIILALFEPGETICQAILFDTMDAKPQEYGKMFSIMNELCQEGKLKMVGTKSDKKWQKVSADMEPQTKKETKDYTEVLLKNMINLCSYYKISPEGTTFSQNLIKYLGSGKEMRFRDIEAFARNNNYLVTRTTLLRLLSNFVSDGIIESKTEGNSIYYYFKNNL